MFNKAKRLNWAEARRLAQERKDLHLSKRTPTVLVGMGMYRSPAPETVNKTVALMADFTEKMQDRYTICFQQRIASTVGDMRSHFVGAMLEHEEYTHLLFIDDDMHFPVNDGWSREEGRMVDFNPLIRLMSLDKDIVGALCFSRNKKVIPFIGMETEDGISKFDFPPTVIVQGDPFRVDFIGFGMVLIKRQVFEAILALGFSVHGMFRYYNCWGTSAASKANVQALLESNPDADTLIREVNKIQSESDQLSEDYSFCKLARNAGCEVWCDPSWDCEHLGTYGYGRKDWLSRGGAEQIEAYRAKEPVAQEA